MPTAAYLAAARAFGKAAMWMVEIDLGRCSLTYTQGACTATDQGDGNRCYYSLPTCQVPAAYSRTTRTLRFCSNSPPWPDNTVAVAPYLLEVASIPQKIDPEKLFVYPEKIELTFSADWRPPAPDSDKGAGFYNTARVGEFWRNLTARNRNYVGRLVRVYRGFSAPGFLLADFNKVGPTYQLKMISVDAGQIKVVCESPLVKLNEKVCPVAISDDNTVQVAIGTGDTTVTVKDASEYPDPAVAVRNLIYAELESEIVQITARNTGTNVLTIVRARLGTAAAPHGTTVKVKHVAFFGTDNGANAPTAKAPSDVILDLLEWAGIAPADVNTTAFAHLKSAFWPTADIKRTVRNPTKVAALMQPIREIRGILVFMDAAGLWSAVAMAPEERLADLTEDTMVEKSVGVKDDDEARLTRASLFYSPTEENPGEDSKFYGKQIKIIDTELESANYFNGERPKLIFDPWLDPAVLIAQGRIILRRYMTRFRFGLRTIKNGLEIRDGTINVGNAITISTRQILDRDGLLDVRPCIVIGRKEVGSAQTELESMDTNLSGRYLRIGPDTMADTYDVSTAADQAWGYWGDTNNRVGAVKDLGYIFW